MGNTSSHKKPVAKTGGRDIFKTMKKLAEHVPGPQKYLVKDGIMKTKHTMGEIGKLGGYDTPESSCIDRAMNVRRDLEDIARAATNAHVPQDLVAIGKRITTALQEHNISNNNCPISPVDGDTLEHLQLAFMRGCAIERKIVLPHKQSMHRKDYFTEYIPLYMRMARILLSPEQFVKYLYVCFAELYDLHVHTLKHNKTATKETIVEADVAFQQEYEKLAKFVMQEEGDRVGM